MTAENFEERVIAQKAVERAGLETKHQVCAICKKHFTSENSYQSHLRSRKHRDKEATTVGKEQGIEATTPEEDSSRSELKNGTEHAQDASIDTIEQALPRVDSNKLEEEVHTESDYEPEPLEITECLFCPHESKDLEANLKHMSLKHGFFLPDLDYLVDIKGLITYLCEKVGMGYTCLYCCDKGKAFHSVEAVQQHMVDKCHCKIFFEGDATLEYAEYYDYTKSYPDSDKRDIQVETSDVETKAVPNSSLNITDDLELVLPSGSKVGHRSMKQLYKQRLPSMDQRKSALITRLMAQYRALGWKGYGGSESGALRQRNEDWARRMHRARETKLGIKANKFQKHFRPQVVF